MEGAEDAEDAPPSEPADIDSEPAETVSGPGDTDTDTDTVSGPGAEEAVSGPDIPSAGAEQPFASVAPPPPPRRRRRPPKRLLAAVGGVLAVALVAGLLVWQPWSPRPVAPASLSAESPTGTSVQLTWPAPDGGATPDHYVILRDGAQLAVVPGDERSWTNTGLRPGDKFRYEVATQGGGWQSGPSPVAKVTTIAPSPVGLKVASTYTSATLTWQPSPLGPAPDKYVVYNGFDQMATLDGATTSYVQRGLTQDTPFQYRVVAEWGKVASAPSATDSGTIRSAPLDNLQNAIVTPTSIPSGATGATVGRAFPTSWNFAPQCAANACTMTVSLLVPGPQERGFPLTVKVTPSGADYTGSAQAKFAECGGISTTDAIKLTLVPVKSQISNGQWGHWTGTVVATAPYVSLSNGYCPSSSWDFNVSSGGAGSTGATAASPV
jgi:hypothetical protein